MTVGLRLAPAFDPLLLSSVEDAGLNASAPPQQRWQDGWLIRFSPGKAKRARCINALAKGACPSNKSSRSRRRCSTRCNCRWCCELRRSAGPPTSTVNSSSADGRASTTRA